MGYSLGEVQLQNEEVNLLFTFKKIAKDENKGKHEGTWSRRRRAWRNKEPEQRTSRAIKKKGKNPPSSAAQKGATKHSSEKLCEECSEGQRSQSCYQGPDEGGHMTETDVTGKKEGAFTEG